MVWTQTHRHLQISSAHPDLITSIVQRVDILESLLGMTLPDSVWTTPELMPALESYPSPHHQDQRTQSDRERQLALYCGYRISITLLHSQAALATDDWIGQSLSLHWNTGDISLPSQVRHGIITEAVALGSNQGQAAYCIIVEPALNQLRSRTHNRRHHHLSLSELITDILSPYDIEIEIDERLSDNSDYSLQHSVQYNQTDLAYFIQQLALYSITGYYRHDVDKHTLVLIPHEHEDINPDPADISSVLSQNPASLGDTEDRITAISPRINQHIQQSQLHRYDNRLIANYTGSSESGDAEYPTQHNRFIHSHTRLDDNGLSNLATRYQQYQDQHAHLGTLTGNIRHLQLPSAHRIDGNPYVTEPISITAIHHRINNHIPANWLGVTAFDPTTLELNNSADGNSNDESNSANDNDNDNVHHITACYQPYPYHHHIPYGEQLQDIGQPHPSLTGLMSASIIDDNSQAITTDRNHRAHIRYHWQNEDGSQSNDSAQWIPMSSHLVAEHMGQTHPLRHGQQVLIDFIGGDIAHPIIVGSTHNGQGNDNAQHNSIASDTDYIDATSPVWFITQSHTYPIDGIKTQSIDSSRTGDASKDSLINGYNQLMFDAHSDSPQINLYSTSYQSSLTLGHLYQHTDHTRSGARGSGISLETIAAGTLQGSTGLHISSYNASGTSNSHMSHNSHSRLQSADQLQSAYEMLRDTHQAVGLENANTSSNNTNSKVNSNTKDDSQTPFAAFSKDTNDSTLNASGQWQQPNILIDSQRHLALLTGQHSQQTSTKSSHSHATDSTHCHSQTQINQLVAGDIHYYSNKAQTHTAAHGDVTIKAHQDQMRLDSEQVLRLHSRDSIEIIAPDTLTLKSAGSGIELSGGSVTFITPSQVGYKAAKKDWGNGSGMGFPAVHLPTAKMLENLDYYLTYIVHDQDDEPLPFNKCMLIKPDGSTEVHTTDHKGKLKILIDDEPKDYELHVIVHEVEELNDNDDNVDVEEAE